MSPLVINDIKLSQACFLQQYNLGQEGNILFNDALTFYLQLHGIGHMVKDHSDSKRENSQPPIHGLLF